jgi:hypothetical protein
MKRNGLAHRLAAMGVEAAQRLGGRNTAGERELLDVDHLPLHRHGHQHA